MFDTPTGGAVISGMVLLVYIILCLIWGSTWMAIKIGLEDAPPLYAALLRFVVAIAILSVIVKVRGSKYPSTLRSFLRLGYPGFWIYTIDYALIYLAEQHINSATTAVVFGVFPFAVAMFSAKYLRHERIDKKVWLGLFIGLIGLILISYDSLQTSPTMLMGILLTLGAALGGAYGLILLKKYHSEADIFVALNVQVIVGAAILSIFAVTFERFGDFRWTLESVGSIVYLAVLGTVTAFGGYYWLLKKASAVTASSIALVTPLVAVIIGTVFFDETLSTLVLTGGALILSGIVMVIRHR